MKKEKQIISITNIKINLPNKNIELNSDEARQVYKELKELFSKEDKNEFEKMQEEYNKKNPPVYYYPVPIYIQETPNYLKPPWTITCISTEIVKPYLGDPPNSYGALAGNYHNTAASSNAYTPKYTTCLTMDLVN